MHRSFFSFKRARGYPCLGGMSALDVILLVGLRLILEAIAWFLRVDGFLSP